MINPKVLLAHAATPTGEWCASRFAQAGYDLVLVDTDLRSIEALGLRLHSAFGVASEMLPADLSSNADLARIERHLLLDRDITSFAFAASGPELIAGNGRISDLRSALTLQCVSVTRLFSAAAAAWLDARQGMLLLVEAPMPALAGMECELVALSQAYLRDFMQALHENLVSSSVRAEHIFGPQGAGPDALSWQIAKSLWIGRSAERRENPPVIIE